MFDILFEVVVAVCVYALMFVWLHLTCKLLYYGLIYLREGVGLDGKEPAENALAWSFFTPLAFLVARHFEFFV